MSQLYLLSGMDTAAKSSENEPQMDGSQACECGKGMSECSIHPSTPEKWIASMRDSLARTLALPGIKLALDMRHDQAFIEKSSVSLALFDPATCSLKTCQQSFLTDSEPYSQTLPRWGSLRNGVVSEHPIAAHPITETGGGVWLPTPTVSSGAQVAWDKTPGQTGGTTLAGFVKWFPTPKAQDSRHAMSRHLKGGVRWMGNLGEMVQQWEDTPGHLNPDWVEWLMGFPTEFTASKDWATRKSLSKPPSPGNCSEGNNA